MDDETLTNSGGTAGSSSGDTLFSGRFGQTDLSGSTLGNYKLVRKLAEGGMGVVYEAIQTKLDRRVALKVLTDQLSSRPEFLKRFEREAKAAAALNHPNLVQVYDFGEAQGQHYLIMEFVEGEDLAQHIQNHGKLSVTDGLNAIEQAAQALKAACAKSIIHRDIKPSNLMLSRDGIIKVSDMGLAKILTDNTEMTATGVGMGSPHFIAPEQADDSRRVDHRVDIYALGITLLYILTGKKPFDGSSPFSVVLAHVNRPLPTGKELGTDLSEAVEGLIQRMAAKKPEERYQDYDSLIADIQRVRQGEMPWQSEPQTPLPAHQTNAVHETPTPASLPPSSRSLHPALLTGIVVAVLGIVGTGIFVLFSGKKKEQVPTQVQSPTLAAPRDIAQEPRFAPPESREPLRENLSDRESFNAGQPHDDASEHVTRLLGPLDETGHPLAEASIQDMFAAAEKYAKENPANFRDILARFQQVGTKAAGTDFEVRTQQALKHWTGLRNKAANETIAAYKAKVQELMETVGHRDAMHYIRSFPAQLRSDEIDKRIIGEVAVPPPFENESRGNRGTPRPPSNRPAPR